MTSLKKMTTLGLLAICILLPLTAGAQLQPDVDLSCFARLEQPNGKVKKQIVNRQATVFLSWGKLIATFRAPYFNGQDPVDGYIALLDHETKQVVKSWTPTIEGRWEFESETMTKFGRVTIECR